jgi:HlyD family secretion protein
MKKTILVVVALAAVLAAAVYAWRWLEREPSNKIVISGNIELTEVKIAFKMSGRLTELAVNEGDPVKKGMLIARLDNEQLLRQREREQAALKAAESALAQLRTAIEFQRQTIDGEVQARMAELRQAEAKLQELLAGSRPQQIQEARAAVDAARTEAERARKDWERGQALYKNEDISTAQYDQFRTQRERAEANLRQTEQRLALLVEGPRKEDIESARAVVARAQAGLRLTQAAGLELKRKQQETDARQAEIERAHAQIALVESQLKDTEVVSPIDGVVLVKSAEPGETVSAGATIVSIGDIDNPWLRGYINEQDLGRVKLGARVKVTTDSFPGKVYSGRVSFIASQAEFTPKQIQTTEERVKLVYRVKIDVPNPDRELKSNMPADAEILVK